MRQFYSHVTLLICLFAVGCGPNSLSGTYVCDQSKKKADTTIHHSSSDETYMDFTCTVTEFEFAGNSSVVMKMPNGNVASSYVIDKNYVRIKGSGSDILLKIQDENTLTGEAVFDGTYHKK
ncbi:hypothetical protein [Flavisolibacter ginsenosidimutans]|uniref:hypothetical protein n=1 Tax=Flavisolibacter ginsenosidimutans TaxID=661481 RepID=UPI00155AD538|nr:hypothetical protein [Flavisolibacter ginsenosidimutans]